VRAFQCVGPHAEDTTHGRSAFRRRKSGCWFEPVKVLQPGHSADAISEKSLNRFLLGDCGLQTATQVPVNVIIMVTGESNDRGPTVAELDRIGSASARIAARRWGETESRRRFRSRSSTTVGRRLGQLAYLTLTHLLASRAAPPPLGVEICQDAAAVRPCPRVAAKRRPRVKRFNAKLRQLCLSQSHGHRYQIPTNIDHVSSEDRHDGKREQKHRSIHLATRRRVCAHRPESGFSR